MNRFSMLLAVTACGLSWPAAAQPAKPPKAISIVLRPAKPPTPALRYRLVPERRSLVPGNAAVFYHRALRLLDQTRYRRLDDRRNTDGQPEVSVEQLIGDWVSGALEAVPRDRAREVLEAYAAVLKEVELGASRRTCDWEFDDRDDGVALLIPEIQESRELARLVMVKARLAILDGKTDEAMHWLETGLVLGRHVAEGPLLIQALVGIAIDMTMARGIEDLVQAPGTPSLYWALADRPRPFVDLRRPMEGERYMLETELPQLEELGRGSWSLDQTRRFVDSLQHKVMPFITGSPVLGGSGSIPAGIPAALRELGIAAMASKTYPEARRALIAGGRSEAEVDAMPIIQAATLYSYQEYQKLRDERYKWLNLPYPQSFDRVERSLPASVDEKLANPLLTLFLALSSSINPARLAALRLDRQLDAIQCIEAIRMDAAEHGGTLPDRLDAIVEIPVPLDPVNGKAFQYTHDGDSATLFAPLPPGGPNHPFYMIHYRLRLAR